MLERFQRFFCGGFNVDRTAAKPILVSLAFLLLFGCSWGQTAAPFLEPGSWAPNPPTTGGSPSDALGILNWTAGICILGGMVSVVLTRSRMGSAAIVGGCCLITLSYVIAAYAKYVILPVSIVLTIVSILWGYLTIARAWRKR